jgi:hypothetical protein
MLMRAIEFSLLCWADHAPTFCYPSSYPQEEFLFFLTSVHPKWFLNPTTIPY